VRPVSITFARTKASTPAHEPAYEFNAEDLDALTGVDLHNLAICLRSLVSECEARARALEAPAATVPAISDKPVLTVKEAAEALRMSVDSLYRKAKRSPYKEMRVPDDGTRTVKFSAQKVAEHIQKGGKKR
jgi:hypothetical protein